MVFPLIFFSACKCTKHNADMSGTNLENTSELYGTVARNYFVRNDITMTPQEEEFIIDSQSDFDKYFSPAAVMGKDGEPTKIDFNTQIDLCVVLDETDIFKKLYFIDMTRKNDGQIICNYRLTLGRKQSFTIRPCLIVLLDKSKVTNGVGFNRVFVR